MSSNSTFAAFLAICLALMGAVSAQAEDDPRFLVHLTGEGVGTNPNAWIAKGLPYIWMRIVPRPYRKAASAIPPRLTFVSRIVPGEGGIEVRFNAPAIRRALEARDIPYIESPPRFRLRIDVRNRYGRPMAETRAALRDQAQHMAEDLGVLVEGPYPTLFLQWRWLDDAGNVELSVRGPAAVREYAEARRIPAGDPVASLAPWLRETLERVRDAHVHLKTPQSEVWQELTLYLDGRSLDAQVALEEALQREPRVEAVRPFLLSPTVVGYRIRLRGSDNGWLSRWFARHGMVLIEDGDGVWRSR